MDFKYVPALDGLRALAILGVIAYHLGYLVADFQPFTEGGDLGVVLFFVLSGFLITSVLLKEQNNFGQINLKNFYWRRMLRLVPAYLFYLTVLYLFSYQILEMHDAEALHQDWSFPAAFFYLTNWQIIFAEKFTHGLMHTWTLAIEEQFYIFWSLVLWLAFGEKRSRRQIFILVLTSVIVLTVWRSARALTGTSISILNFSTDSRMDALMLGALVSIIFVWKFIPQTFLKSKFFNYLSIAALLVAGWMVFKRTNHDADFFEWSLSAFTVATAIIILRVVTMERNVFHTFLEKRLLRWIGEISYGLYLWNIAAFEVSKKLVSAPVARVALGVGLTFAVSAFSFYLIEKPFLSLKNKFHN